MSAPESRTQFLEYVHMLNASGRSLRDTARESLSGGQSLVLFGAGGFAGYLIPRLKKLGFRVKVLVDSDAGKWGKTVAGVRVVGLDEFRSMHDPLDHAITSVCGHTSDFSVLAGIARSAEFQQVWPAPIFFWLYPEAFLPFLGWAPPDYLASRDVALADVFELLADQTSRSHFARELALRISMDVSDANPPDICNQYFIQEIRLLGAGEIFFDGGAYDGDTLRSYLKRSPEGFRRWMAVEPDLTLQSKLRGFVQTLGREAAEVQIIGAALGDHVGRTHFTADASMTAVLPSTAALEVDMTTVDAVCHEEITFLKLDIEGGEGLVLEGARKTLARSERAVVAVAGYHFPADLVEIPRILKGVAPGRQILCRRHGHFGFDFIFYAAPLCRLRDV